MATRIIEQWFKGNTELAKEGWPERLEERLDELERTMGEWYQALRFGPIPGQYMQYTFRTHDLGGLTPDPFLPQDIVGLPADVRTENENEFYSARPILCTATIYGNNEIPVGGSSLDFNIVAVDSGTGNLTDLLTTDLTVDDSAFVHRAEVGRGDFDVEKFLSPALFLFIRAVNDGIPRTLTVRLYCNDGGTYER